MKLAWALLSLASSVPALADKTEDLHRAIEAACKCQIDGISVGVVGDKSTWRIINADNLTADQKVAAQAAIAAFDVNSPAVPQVVSAMQAKVALSRAGLLSAVQTWISQQDAETQLIWNTAPTFAHSSTLINKAATALNLSRKEVDALFVTAAAINP